MRVMKHSSVDWIGEIPDTWSLNKIKYVAQFQPACRTVGILRNEMVSYSPMECIKQGYYIPREAEYQDIPASLTPYQRGDIVMAKVTPCFENGNIAIMDNISSEVGFGSSELFVFRAFNIETKFLFYWLRNRAFVEEATKSMTGMGGLKRVSPTFVANAPIVVPSIEEQIAIVDFLDRKCSELDQLSNSIQKQIDVLQQYKQSVICEAVTHGIDTGVSLKNSGVPWCPQIPEHWMITNPKALFSLRNQRAIPGERQLTASQKLGIVYQDEFMEMENQRVVTVEKDFSILKHVEPNDFVISMRSFQGGLEYSELTGCISSAYVMLIPNEEKVYPPFYRWFFKSSKYINAIQSTTNLVRDGQAMRYANFVQVPLFIIPVDEQKRIADYLYEKIAKVDAILDAKTKQLEVLENYKKALIYEYITGKKTIEEARS